MTGYIMTRKLKLRNKLNPKCYYFTMSDHFKTNGKHNKKVRKKGLLKKLISVNAWIIDHNKSIILIVESPQVFGHCQTLQRILPVVL